jgi:hypothetical protein
MIFATQSAEEKYYNPKQHRGAPIAALVSASRVPQTSTTIEKARMLALLKGLGQ